MGDQIDWDDFFQSERDDWSPTEIHSESYSFSSPAHGPYDQNFCDVLPNPMVRGPAIKSESTKFTVSVDVNFYNDKNKYIPSLNNRKWEFNWNDSSYLEVSFPVKHFSFAKKMKFFCASTTHVLDYYEFTQDGECVHQQVTRSRTNYLVKLYKSESQEEKIFTNFYLKLFFSPCVKRGEVVLDNSTFYIDYKPSFFPF